MDSPTTALPRNPTPFSHHGGPLGALLIHGFSGTPGELRPLAERLAEQDYSVEAPLLAGHGGSQDELTAVTWRDWITSARQALDTLRARCETVVLVGFSMGGAITLYLAANEADHTERPIAGIVTMSALTRIDSPLTVLLPIARRVMPYIYPLRMRGIDLSKPEVVARLRDYIPDLQVDRSKPDEIAALRRSIKVSVGAVYQLDVLLRHTRAALPRVTAPALLIQSTHDEQIPLSSVDEIYRRIGSRDKQVVRLARSGHMLLAGPECDEVVAHVTAFIEQIGRTAGT